MKDQFPLSLSDVFGVLGIASIAYSVVKDVSGSVAPALGAAVVVAFFGIVGWAIYRAAPRRHERYKLAISHDSEHAISLIQSAEESILVTHFTSDLPSRAYTAAMLARLEHGVPITRIVSAKVMRDPNVQPWLAEFKKHPRYRESVFAAQHIPFEFTVIDEKLVLLYLPIKNDPKLLNTVLIFENEKLAGSVCTMFEGMRQYAALPPSPTVA